MEQVSICHHLGRRGRRHTRTHITKPRKRPLKLTCHNNLLISWSKDVLYLWMHLLSLQTQVQTTHFLPGTMFLPSLIAQDIHKVYNCVNYRIFCLWSIFLQGTTNLFALVEPTDLGAANNSSSSIECQSGTWATSDAIEQETWPTSDAIEQEIILPALHAMPDFAQVYNFLGGVFDPDTTGHLQKLREMDPIDAETVLQLMKNLSVNLSGPDFETHLSIQHP
uniref:Uncharacterized protein n=1 Tax=Aegilops tauschii subsp. strangulata TaxID=200361 RepID=A0A453QBZ1_AEGTS